MHQPLNAFGDNAIFAESRSSKLTLVSSHWPQYSRMVLEQQPILAYRMFYPGEPNRCFLVLTTGSSLPCKHNLLTVLTGNKENLRRTNSFPTQH